MVMIVIWFVKRGTECIHHDDSVEPITDVNINTNEYYVSTQKNRIAYHLQQEKHQISNELKRKFGEIQTLK